MERHNPLVSPIVTEIQRLDSEQRRRMRQICFWALLAYLEFTWFGMAMLPVTIAAAATALVVAAARRTPLGVRPSFAVLHAALLAMMILSLVDGGSRVLLADFAALALLVTLELVHRRPGFLLAIAAEHVCGLALDPWSAIVRMNDPALPGVGAIVLVRIFAIIMLLALFVRVAVVPRFAPPKEESPAAATPPPSRPLSAAEWDARKR